MSTCLRTSSSIARLSRRNIEYTRHTRLCSPASTRTPRAVHPWRTVRNYATEQPKDPEDPKDPQDPKDKRPAKTSKEGGDGHGQKPDKPGKKPPGLEHVYSKGSPLSKSPADENATTESKAEAPQVSKLSVEEERILDQIMAILTLGMPESRRKDTEKAIDLMKKEGIPDEMKEVIEQFKKKKTITISDSARIVRLMSSIARKAAEVEVRRQPKQKAGAHDPGPQDKNQKQTNQGPGIFFRKNSNSGSGSEDGKFFGIKLDTSTFLTAAFVSYMVYRSVMPGENSREITWQEFKTQYLDRGLVEKLTVINRRSVKVYLNRDAVRSVYPDSPAAHANFYYYFSIGDVGSFERHLDQAHDQLQIPSNQRIPVSFEEPTPWLGTLLSFGPTLLLIGGTYWIFRRSSGGNSSGASGLFGMGRSRAKKFNHETDIKISFKDVAGMDEAKTEIMEFVSFLKEPGMYQKLGAKIPRGAILSGPPGTGKTLLAKATAGESQVPFFSVSGSEFVEMFVGVGASRVRDMFSNARKNAPCIIFIDEIDAIGKSRGKNIYGSGGNDEREATLNQILTEMDGFNTSEQVVVLAGTNRADVLDKALMRPGRFDRHITIDRPTMEGRKQIFAVHLAKIVTKEDSNQLHGRLAALTPGFSGADIANCVNEAALIAARRNAESVTMEHFEAAIERVVGGLEKKSLVLNPEEKKTVAYHEAGHAICGWYFKYADPLLKVSIIPRGQGALGYAQYLPSGDTYLMNVNQLMDRMAMTLGGRVSEELHFETVTSGASDDFNKVTRMATAMVTKFGMSEKVGYLYFEDDPSQQLHKPFSEDTARSIDQEVRRIVDEAYKQCRDLLTEKKKEIGLVAEELLEKEVLSRDDLIRILGPRPFEDKSDFAKYFGNKSDREGAPGSTSSEPPSGGLSLGGGVGPAPTIFKDAQCRKWA